MTTFTTATATKAAIGPLTQTVYDFCAAQANVLAAGVTKPSDWEPMARYLAPGFKRVGAYLEEFDYAGYCDFLTGWAAGGTQFEYTEFHVSEVGDTVFQEIEERHRRGDQFIRKNVIAVYRFTPEGRIRHLDIYEQATDSGQWIVKAAADAMPD